MIDSNTLYRLALDIVVQIPGGKRDVLAVLAEAQRIANKLDDNDQRPVERRFSVIGGRDLDA